MLAPFIFHPCRNSTAFFASLAPSAQYLVALAILAAKVAAALAQAAGAAAATVEVLVETAFSRF